MIVKNAAKCLICGDIIESNYTHDFVGCSCFISSGGTAGIAVDGGLDYQRRIGYPSDYQDLSEYTEDKTPS